MWRESGEGVIGLCAESLPELMGYRRPDGRVGVRNHVLILPTITCATQAARRVTDLVHGTVSFIHQHGCAQVGADYEQTFRTYVGMGTHPNVYGVVVMGLGWKPTRPEASPTRSRRAENRWKWSRSRITEGRWGRSRRRPGSPPGWCRTLPP